MRVMGWFISIPGLFTGDICPTLGQIAHCSGAQLTRMVFLLKNGQIYFQNIYIISLQYNFKKKGKIRITTFSKQ